MSSVRRYGYAAAASFIITVAAIALSVASRTAGASTPPSLDVAPPSQTVAPGATFTVTIRQNSTVATSGAQATVHFDATQLQIDTVGRGSAYTGSSLLVGVAPNTGNLAITEANTTGELKNFALFFSPGTGPAPSGDQPAMVLTMHALAGASGPTPFYLTAVELGGADGTPIAPVGTTPGEVNVNNPGVPTITRTPTPTATACDGACPPTNTPTQTATSTATLTGNETATLTPTSTKSPTPTNTVGSTTPTLTPTATISPTRTATPTWTPEATYTTTSKTGSVFVAPTAITVPPNSDFTFFVNQTATFDTSGTGTDLKFNKDLLQLVSVEKAPAFGTAALQAGIYLDAQARNQTLDEAIAEANTTGVLQNVTSYYIPGGTVIASGENSFLTFGMKALGATGTSDLKLEQAELIDAEGVEIHVASAGGQITVQTGAPTQVPPTPAVAATNTPKPGAAGATTGVLGSSRSPSGTTATGARGLPRTGDRASVPSSIFAIVAFLGAACTLASGGLAVRQWTQLQRRRSS